MYRLIGLRPLNFSERLQALGDIADGALDFKDLTASAGATLDLVSGILTPLVDGKAGFVQLLEGEFAVDLVLAATVAFDPLVISTEVRHRKQRKVLRTHFGGNTMPWSLVQDEYHKQVILGEVATHDRCNVWS